MDSLHPGQPLGPYEIVSALPSDGERPCYRARHAPSRTSVVIKLADETNPTQYRHLAEELRFLQQTRHDSLVHLIDAGKQGTTAWIALEDPPGDSLSTWVDALGPGDRVRRILHVGAQVAQLLSTVHAAGLLLLDLRPEILRVSPNGTVRLLDVHNLRWLDGGGPVNLVGASPRYAAPELLAGQLPDCTADFYSLGVLLYELLTDRSLHPATEPDALLTQQCGMPAPALADVLGNCPPSASAVIDQMLCKFPQGRPSSAREISSGLRAAQDEVVPDAVDHVPSNVVPILGRDSQLAALDAFLARPPGQPIVLAAAHGAGLSRMLHELAGGARLAGARAVFAQAGPDLLSGVLSCLAGPRRPAEEREALLGSDQALILGLMPELRRPSDQVADATLASDAGRTAQRDAIRRVLRRSTTLAPLDRPLVLAIDDAERADADDLAALLGPWHLVLGTHDATALATPAERLALPPLSDEVMVDLARQTMGERGVVVAMAHRSDIAGRPAELLAIARSGNEAVPATPVPVDFDPRWLDVLRDAESALASQNPYQAMHVLDSNHPPEGLPAGLLYRAALLRARAAFQIGDDELAVSHARKAMATAPTDIDRNRARMEEARCLLRAGHYTTCLTETVAGLREARDLGADVMETRWRILQARIYARLGRFRDGRRTAELAMTAPLLDAGSGIGLMWTAATLAVAQCRYDEARAFIGGVREAMGDNVLPRIEAGLMKEEGLIRLRMGQISQAVLTLSKAKQTFSDVDDMEHLADTGAALAHATLLGGRVGQAVALGEEIWDVVTRTKSRLGSHRALLAGLHLARVSGNPALCEMYSARAMKLDGEWLREPFAAPMHAERALALMELGDKDGAIGAMSEAVNIECEDPHDRLLIRLREAELRWALGEKSPDAALALAQEARERGLLGIHRLAMGLAIRGGAPDTGLTDLREQAQMVGDIYGACWLAACGPARRNAAAKARRYGFGSLARELEKKA